MFYKKKFKIFLKLNHQKFTKIQREKIDYPENISFVKPLDFYTNYPIILHGSKDLAHKLKSTLDAFREILGKQNLTLNKTISISLAWEMTNFEVRISIFGKSSQILKWLKINTTIPVSYEDFQKWLIEQKNWIYSQYTYREMDFFHLLREDGIFYIKRENILSDNITFSNQDGRESYQIQIENDEEISKLVENQEIFPSYLILINKATCSLTELDYFNSATSKYLDDNVNMIIEESKLLDFFWSDEKYN